MVVSFIKRFLLTFLLVISGSSTCVPASTATQYAEVGTGILSGVCSWQERNAAFNKSEASSSRIALQQVLRLVHAVLSCYNHPDQAKWYQPVWATIDMGRLIHHFAGKVGQHEHESDDFLGYDSDGEEVWIESSEQPPLDDSQYQQIVDFLSLYVLPTVEAISAVFAAWPSVVMSAEKRQLAYSLSSCSRLLGITVEQLRANKNRALLLLVFLHAGETLYRFKKIFDVAPTPVPSPIPVPAPVYLPIVTDDQKQETTTVLNKSADKNGQSVDPTPEHKQPKLPMLSIKQPESIINTVKQPVAEDHLIQTTVHRTIDMNEVCPTLTGNQAVATDLYRQLAAQGCRLQDLAPQRFVVVNTPGLHGGRAGREFVLPDGQKKAGIEVNVDELQRLQAQHPDYAYGAIAMMLAHEAAHLNHQVDLKQSNISLVVAEDGSPLQFERAADVAGARARGCHQCMRDWAAYLADENNAIPGGITSPGFRNHFEGRTAGEVEAYVNGLEQVSNNSGSTHPTNEERAARMYQLSMEMRNFCPYHAARRAPHAT